MTAKELSAPRYIVLFLFLHIRALKHTRFSNVDNSATSNFKSALC